MLKYINHIEDYACRILLGVFVLLIFFQVILRTLFGFGMAWMEELARFAFVWFVFLGAAHAAHLGAHNRLQIHINLLPKKIRNLLLLFVDLIWVGFCLVMVVYSFNLISLMLEFTYITPAMNWSLAYVYLIFPISFGLMAFRVLQVHYLRWIKGMEPLDMDQQQIDEIIEIEAGHPDRNRADNKRS